jgi:hypothetical protein
MSLQIIQKKDKSFMDEECTVEEYTLIKINELCEYVKPKIRFNKVYNTICFNNIYNIYNDILSCYDLDGYLNTFNGIDGKYNIISVMTEGLICCIKVFYYHKNKNELIKRYIENTVYLLTEKYYYANNHISVMYAIKTLFMKKKRDLSQLFNLNFKEMEYYTIQKTIDKLLYEEFLFHAGYINFVTLAFYSFIMTTNQVGMENEINTKYLKCLYDFLLFQKKNDICHYDEPSKQKTLIYLDTMSFE